MVVTYVYKHINKSNKKLIKMLADFNETFEMMDNDDDNMYKYISTFNVDGTKRKMIKVDLLSKPKKTDIDARKEYEMLEGFAYENRDVLKFDLVTRGKFIARFIKEKIQQKIKSITSARSGNNLPSTTEDPVEGGNVGGSHEEFCKTMQIGEDGNEQPKGTTAHAQKALDHKKQGQEPGH